MAKVNININKLLKKFLPKFIKSMMLDYSIGSAVSIHNAKIQGKETAMNPLNMNKTDQKTNSDIIESLIKDVNSDVAKKINYIVNKGITQRLDNKMVADEISKLNIEETYKNRYKAIARTESMRIMSNSSFNSAKKLGFTHKYIVIVNDNRTSPQSKEFYKKYGGEDKSIHIDEMFKITYNGKEYSGLYAPFMPNDRDDVIYTMKDYKE